MSLPVNRGGQVQVGMMLFTVGHNSEVRRASVTGRTFLSGRSPHGDLQAWQTRLGMRRAGRSFGRCAQQVSL